MCATWYRIHYQRRCLHRHTHKDHNLPLPAAFSALCPTYYYNRHQQIRDCSFTTRYYQLMINFSHNKLLQFNEGWCLTNYCKMHPVYYCKEFTTGIQTTTLTSGPPSTSNFECQICHRMCRSRIGLLAHNKSHSWWWDPSYQRLSPWQTTTRLSQCAFSVTKATVLNTMLTYITAIQTDDFLLTVENTYVTTMKSLETIQNNISKNIDYVTS